MRVCLCEDIMRAVRRLPLLLALIMLACAGDAASSNLCLDCGRSAGPRRVVLLYPAESPLLRPGLVGEVGDWVKPLGPPLNESLGPGESVDAWIAAHQNDRKPGLVIVFASDVLAPARVTPAEVAGLPDESFIVRMEDRAGPVNALDGGPSMTVVHLAAKGRLGLQYAVYELGRRLGVRFFHPEQIYTPEIPASQVRARVKAPTALAHKDASGHALDVHTPDFTHRSFSYHGAHPLEVREAFSDAAHPIAEAEHVMRWMVANRADLGRGAMSGVASAESSAKRAQEIEDLRVAFGLRRTGGITLHNEQQGASATIDPSLPTPVKDQIETFVKALLQAAPDIVHFGVHFGPTELTTTPDQETVQWIEWAGLAVKALRPDLAVWVNDHTTGSQPTPHFDDLGCPPGTNADERGDYYDLAFHTDVRLGAQVHTTMFYPLEGAAPVYLQKSFAHKLCLMQKASSGGRALRYFPEGAYWLSFDNAVPLYLPLYIHSRGRDIELLKPLLASRGTGTLRDHHLFDTGHEWGYWQQDYAVGMWHWNADVPMKAVLEELADPMCDPAVWPASCEARDEVVSVLTGLMAHQKAYFLDAPDYTGRTGALYFHMAGEDPADELGAASGLEFRPVRPSFAKIAGFEIATAAAFTQIDLAALDEMDVANGGFLARLKAIEPLVPKDGLPWLAEILDGIDNNMLRARHIAALYRAAMAYGKAKNVAAAEPHRAQAAMVMKQAAEVIARREAHYRYPAAQCFGEGPNGTTYPYRLYTKAHKLAYWTYRQQALETLIGTGAMALDAPKLTPAFAKPSVPVSIAWPKIPGLSAQLAIGGGQTVGVEATSYALPAGQGRYAVSGQISALGSVVKLDGAVARADVRLKTSASAWTITKPAAPTAQAVIAAIAPDVLWAWIPASDSGMGPVTIAFAADLEGNGDADYRDVRVAYLPGEPTATFASNPFEMSLPIAGTTADGKPLAVRIHGATLSGAIVSGLPSAEFTLHGDLVLADIVAALVALAGYDDKGAYKTLSGVLGFDPAMPPPAVPVEATLGIELL